MEFYVGKYEHIRSENMDEFLKSMGAPFIARKLLTYSNPTIEVEHKEDGSWIVRTIMAIKTFEIKFKPDEEVEFDHFFGKHKATFHFDGAIMHQVQSGKETEVEILREFSADGLLVTMKNKKSGHISTRTFKRI